MSGWFVLAPLALMLLGGLAIMLVDAFTKEKAELATLTSVVFLAAGGSAVGLWFGAPPAEIPAQITAYLAVDKMSLFFDITICGGGLLSVLLAGGYLPEHDQERGEYYPIVLFAAFGAMVLARANDLLTIFVGLETLSLGVYSLVAFRRTSPRSAEGALKYFMLGSFAAAILLFGSALLYGATGHTDLAGIGAGIAAGTADVRLVVLALVLLIIGLAFKVSAVPFHMWTPDAYEGAMTPVTAFMSVVVKAAAFAVLVRVLLVAYGDPLSASGATGWPPVIAGLAAITMIYGNLAAVGQTSVKRMLAYSSIAHAGYLLVGVAAAATVGGIATSAVFFYLMAYTVSNVLTFGSLILLGSHGKEAVSYEDLAGAGRRHPAAGLAFTLGTLSLMGFPTTAGFFGKYLIFSAAVQAGNGMILLSVLGVLTSAIGAFYYLRVLVYLFFKEPQAGAPIAVPMKSGYVVVALVLASYFVLKMGLTPAFYLDMALQAAGLPTTAS